jgi:hypothetical protein
LNELFRKSDRFVKTKWQDIRVGDIVHLSCEYVFR